MATQTPITPSGAAQELLNRRAARLNLLDYAQYVDPTYIVGDVHEILAEKLEAVERGEITRLMVQMPPRHGKSREVSQLFPDWYLGRNPSRDVVQAGYGIKIALEHSRIARDGFADAKHHKVFPGSVHTPERSSQESIAVQKQAANLWRTSKNGSYYAVGVGGALTGRGADLLIIDDPVKNREEAESPTQRAKVMDWYRSTARTRLAPGGAIIIVMTRWHPDDLVGVLLKQMETEGTDPWEVVSFPAINEDGEALWPERYSLKELESIKADIGSYEWSALYDQRPVKRGGNLFKVGEIDWIQDESEFPDVPYTRAWDLASTLKERAKDDPDYTASAKVAVTYDDEDRPHLWIIDISAFLAEATERNQRIERTAIADGASVRVGIESVAGYKDAFTTVRDVLKGIRTVDKITTSKDKVVRASVLEPLFEAGHVHVLVQPKGDLLLQQFTEFPSTGSHDDIVDAVVIAYEMHMSDDQVFTFSRKGVGI